MKKNINKIYFIIAFFVLFNSCEKAAEWYLGFNKQPDFFDGEEYTKAINVFGVIRPNLVEEEQQSFVRVEKTVSSKEIEFSDSLSLKEASVWVSFDDGTSLKSLNFNYEKLEDGYVDGLFKTDGLQVSAGQTFTLECSYDGYDTVFASTVVPNQPIVLGASIKENQLELEIEEDETAHLYEIVYCSVSLGYHTPVDGKNKITIELDSAFPSQGEVYIYAYDKNLADYFSDVTSSIINLNSFRAPYTTVDGGFGCFGSLNYTKLIIE